MSLLQRLLGPLAVGLVYGEDRNGDDLAVFIEDGTNGGFHKPFQSLILEADRLARADDLCTLPAPVGDYFWRHESEHVVTDHRINGCAKTTGHGLVGNQDSPLLVQQHNGLRASVDQRSQRPFAVTQSCLCPFPFTDVQYLGDEVARLSLRIEDQSRAYLAPKDLTALVEITLFKTLEGSHRLRC